MASRGGSPTLGSPNSYTYPASKAGKNFEPMNVTYTSPKATNVSTPQYLPGFLMGDFHASPAKGYQVTPILTSQPHPSTSQHAKTAQPRLSGVKPPNLERSVRRHASPPTQSLWANANLKSSSVQENDLCTIDSTAKRLVSSPLRQPLSRMHGNSSKCGTPFHSPLQVSALEKSHIDGSSSLPDDESATWITVFGYDPSQATFVLQHFSHLGTIEKFVITNGGNWMNIKYANKIQARCALNRNGRVLDGRFMIGVRKCTDLNAINSFESIVQNNFTAADEVVSLKDGGGDDSRVYGDVSKSPESKFQSPLIRGGLRIVATAESPNAFNSSFAGGLNCSGPTRSTTTLSRHSSMRPLAAPYQPPPRGQVVRASHNQSFRGSASKSSGLLSKALDYVFGWN